MTVLTNHEVQEVFSKAITKLESKSSLSETELHAKFVIQTIKELSKSGNNIPALRSQGLEDCLKLSKAIIEDQYIKLRFNTKYLSLSIYD